MMVMMVAMMLSDGVDGVDDGDGDDVVVMMVVVVIVMVMIMVMPMLMLIVRTNYVSGTVLDEHA